MRAWLLVRQNDGAPGIEKQTSPDATSPELQALGGVLARQEAFKSVLDFAAQGGTLD